MVLTNASRKVGRAVSIGRRTAPHTAQTKFFIASAAGIALRPPGLLLPSEYATRVKQLHAWAKRAGRDPKAVALTLRVPMEVRAKMAKAPAGDRPMFQGTPAEIGDDLQAYATLGVSHVIFDAAHSDLKSVLQNMERFAQDVRPVVASAAKSAPAAGGLLGKRRGSVVASGARPARAAGGPSQKRRGSASKRRG